MTGKEGRRNDRRKGGRRYDRRKEGRRNDREKRIVEMPGKEVQIATLRFVPKATEVQIFR